MIEIIKEELNIAKQEAIMKKMLSMMFAQNFEVNCTHIRPITQKPTALLFLRHKKHGDLYCDVFFKTQCSDFRLGIEPKIEELSNIANYFGIKITHMFPFGRLTGMTSVKKTITIEAWFKEQKQKFNVAEDEYFLVFADGRTIGNYHWLF
jgi:hypothetical protein